MTIKRPITIADITLAVLAGGRGTRMGLPKARLRIADKPILTLLLDRIRWPGPTMLVSAPGVVHPPGVERFDREVIDPIDGLGPLRGILTALENISTPTAAMITVDMPGVETPAIAWMAEELARSPNCLGVMCRVTTDGAQRIEPFPSIFRAAAAPTIAMRLESGRRSVHELCSDQNFAALDAPQNWPTEMWMNLNTPADLATFESAEIAKNKTRKDARG
jgi:molybdopterin-guanine dinucleotide biosynthesis protein A